LPPAHLVGVGNAKADQRRVGLGDGGEQHGGAGDQRALRHLRAADDAANRRLDPGVAQVQRGFGAAGLRALEVSAGNGLGRGGVVKVFLADGLGLEQRLQARLGARGLTQAGFGGRHIGIGAVQHGFQGRRVQRIQRLAARHGDVPSRKLRLSRMPEVRARTSTSREPAAWPTYS
jgi:hypothetical protein